MFLDGFGPQAVGRFSGGDRARPYSAFGEERPQKLVEKSSLIRGNVVWEVELLLPPADFLSPWLELGLHGSHLGLFNNPSHSLGQDGPGVGGGVERVVSASPRVGVVVAVGRRGGNWLPLTAWLSSEIHLKEIKLP